MQVSVHSDFLWACSRTSSFWHVLVCLSVCLSGKLAGWLPLLCAGSRLLLLSSALLLPSSFPLSSFAPFLLLCILPSNRVSPCKELPPSSFPFPPSSLSLPALLAKDSPAMMTSTRLRARLLSQNLPFRRQWAVQPMLVQGQPPVGARKLLARVARQVESRRQLPHVLILLLIL